MANFSVADDNETSALSVVRDFLIDTFPAETDAEVNLIHVRLLPQSALLAFGQSKRASLNISTSALHCLVSRVYSFPS